MTREGGMVWIWADGQPWLIQTHNDKALSALIKEYKLIHNGEHGGWYFSAKTVEEMMRWAHDVSLDDKLDEVGELQAINTLKMYQEIEQSDELMKLAESAVGPASLENDFLALLPKDFKGIDLNFVFWYGVYLKYNRKRY